MRLMLGIGCIICYQLSAVAEFKIDVQDLISGARLTPVIALPGQQLNFATYGDESTAVFSAEVDIEAIGNDRWAINAPRKSGAYPVHITSSDGTVKTLQLIVTKPFENKSYLSGYRIGIYPPASDAPNPQLWSHPQGLIEVRQNMLNTPLSTHFTLGQFLCKQGGGWPRYLVLQRSLVLYLEDIVSLLQREGIDATTLTVMSGYRTPYYNAAIGNVTYSRHQYGDAADVYVDSDGDKFMDDLNGDGVVSVKDAQLLARLIATLPAARTSGVGIYAATATHGPFVHIDTRGYKARWGP
jgi:hypothetical protein